MKRVYSETPEPREGSGHKRKKVGTSSAEVSQSAHKEQSRPDSSRSDPRSGPSSEDREGDSDNSKSSLPPVGPSKTTDTEANSEKSKKGAEDKSSLRGKEKAGESEEWKHEAALRKCSRVDPVRYQAAVPEVPGGQDKDLVLAVETIKSRCQFRGEDPLHAATIDEFRQFVRWFANEQTCNSANGPWLCGSLQSEQQSLKILHSVNYSVVKAKFWLLFPTAARARPSPLTTLTEEVLLEQVQAALQNLIGYKKEEQAKLVAHVLDRVNSTGIDMSELQEYFALFEKHDWDVPPELEALRQKAEERSNALQKMFDGKMSYEEALGVGQAAGKVRVRTPETQLAADYAERARKWVEKSQNIREKWVAMKTLQRLVNEAKGLPVVLPALDEVKKRFECAHEWYRAKNQRDSMTNLYKLLKNSKTRTGNNAERCSEEEIETCLRDAERIRFTNPDLEKQKEYLERIREWKNRVSMMFEDERLEKSPETITALLKETLEFKFNVKLISDLEAMMASYKWLGNVQRELAGKSGATIESLQSLISEGKTHHYDPQKVEQLSAQLHAATQLKLAIQRALRSEKTTDVDLLEELNSKAECIGIEIKEKHALAKLLLEVRAWRENCHKTAGGPCRVDGLEQLKKEAERLKVTCKEYEKLCADMQPVVQWLGNASRFLAKYVLGTGKTGARTSASMEQIAQQLKKKNSPEKHLESLVAAAGSDIARATDEFQQLKTMKDKLTAWEDAARKIIERYLKENTLSKDAIQTLLRKVWEHPINKEIGLQLLDICDHQEWVKKAQEASTAKVPVHVLETVLREGNGFTVKTNEISGLLRRLEEKVAGAKQWVARHKALKADVERRKDKMQLAELEAVIKDGESLNVKIREIEWLTELYAEVKKLRADSQSTLQGSASFSSLESLITKIETCEVHIPELRLLKALYEVCAVWRKIALQVIRSRQALSLSMLNAFPAVESATKSNGIAASPAANHSAKEHVVIVLERDADGHFTVVEVQNSVPAGSKASTEPVEAEIEDDLQNPEYCVCRKGDDESEQDMIACDVCDEWFHLECVNMTKELSVSMQHFVCSACVRRKQISFYYPDCLDSIKRISEQEFERLLREGHRMPVQFTELKLLEEVRARLERWKSRAGRLLGQGIQYELYAEYCDGKKERGKRDHADEAARTERALAKLFLESENFPVETELSKQVMHMLMVRDWVREALKCRHTRLSGRKCRKIIEQGQALCIGSHPQLQGLHRELVAIYNKQQMFPGESAAGGSEEDQKEEQKHVPSQTQTLAGRLASAIRQNTADERAIIDMYQTLVHTGKSDAGADVVMGQTAKVLQEVDKFKAAVRQARAAGNRDPLVIEGLCKRSLTLGCMPDNVSSSMCDNRIDRRTVERAETGQAR